MMSTLAKQELGSPTMIETILTGAFQEFLASGYSGASMDRIALTAGVSKSTLYTYFKSKEWLFSTLIERIIHDRISQIFRLDTLLFEYQDPTLVLRQLADRIVRQVFQDPQMIALLRLLMFEADRFPQLGRVIANSLRKPSFDALSQYLSSCSNLRLSDPEAAARIFIGTLVHFGIIQEGMYGKELMPMDVDRIIHGLIELILCSD